MRGEYSPVNVLSDHTPDLALGSMKKNPLLLASEEYRQGPITYQTFYTELN